MSVTISPVPKQYQTSSRCSIKKILEWVDKDRTSEQWNPFWPPLSSALPLSLEALRPPSTQPRTGASLLQWPQGFGRNTRCQGSRDKGHLSLALHFVLSLINFIVSWISKHTYLNMSELILISGAFTFESCLDDNDRQFGIASAIQQVSNYKSAFLWNLSGG